MDLGNTPIVFVLVAAVAGAAAGKLIAWLSYAIPHRMALAWHEEGLEAVASIDPSKPMAQAVFKEWLALCILGAALCAAGFSAAPAGLLQGAAFCVFLLGLLLLAWIDAKTYLLPDTLVYPLLWMGLIANLNGLFVPLDQAVTGAVAGYASFWLIAKGFALLMRREGMGHGDFKLLAAMGAWFGWTVLPCLVVLAAVVGLLLAMGRAVVLKSGATGPLPFGPSLAIAGALVGFIQLTHQGGVGAMLRAMNLA